MNELKEIEKRIQNLPPEDLAKFREWFVEFDWKAWDSQIEEDLKSGKLDRLVSEALADFEAGKAREL